MKQYNVRSKGSFASKFVLITMLGCFSSFSVANAEPLYSKGDWLFGLNAAKVFTNETLDSISAGGAPIPGSGIDISDDTTLSFDVSYFLNSSLALNFFGGFPATADLTGTGSLGGMTVGVKWSQKTGQSSKVYPKPLRGYENGEAPELYGPV